MAQQVAEAAVETKGFLGDQICIPDRFPLREKRKYLEWVRSVADTLQAPGELKRLASYDSVFSATPHRVVEFTFDSLEDAARYFSRKEVSVIFQSDLPAHGTNIRINVLALRGDYSAGTTGAWKPPAAGSSPSRPAPCESKYWCEQDVSRLRANARLIMVYHHTGRRTG